MTNEADDELDMLEDMEIMDTDLEDGKPGCFSWLLAGIVLLILL